MKISIKITDNNFSTEMKEEMWSVYRNYYNYTREGFMERFSKNNEFAIYRHEGKLIGFTGLKIDRTKIEGKKSLLIYFGQTVIDKKFRGNALIPFTGLKLCFKYFKDLMVSDVYFWCDALSYKSYLVCAKSLSTCYPSYKQETPKEAKSLINYLGHKHYEGSFCEALGTIEKSTQLVNDPSTRINSHNEKDEDIRFFMKANPHHAQGHGLITLAPLNAETFTKVLKRQTLATAKNTIRSISQTFNQLIPSFNRTEKTTSPSL
jgi:hypothetical protein